MECAETVTKDRLEVWNSYHEALAAHEAAEQLRRPVIPEGCAHNGHIYYVILPTAEARDDALRGFLEAGVEAQFHYVPLHSSPAGRALGRPHGDLAVTADLAARLLRLPLWFGMGDETAKVLEAVETVLGSQGSR